MEVRLGDFGNEVKIEKMRGEGKMYKCLKCGKRFEEAVVVEDKHYGGKMELFPFCKSRVYPRRGIIAVVLVLWRWVKKCFKKG